MIKLPASTGGGRWGCGQRGKERSSVQASLQEIEIRSVFFTIILCNFILLKDYRLRFTLLKIMHVLM